MTDENLDDIKKNLEIEKLKAEIKHSHRNFLAHMMNTLILGGIGLAVLYFVQRPQVVEMEAARTENEKNHVAALVIAAQGIANDSEKRLIISMLANFWPQFTFTQAIDKSVSENAEISKAVQEGGSHNTCEIVASEIKTLNGTIARLASAAAIRRRT